MRYSSFIKVYEADDVSESISKIQEWWNNNMDIEKIISGRMMLSNLKAILIKDRTNKRFYYYK
jgi:hypothetical protein